MLLVRSLNNQSISDFYCKLSSCSRHCPTKYWIQVEINQAGGDVTQVPRPTLWIIPEAGNDFGCLCSQNIFRVLPMGKLPAWLNVRT